jgi:hypothetical protein
VAIDNGKERSKRQVPPLTPLRCVRGSDAVENNHVRQLDLGTNQDVPK